MTKKFKIVLEKEPTGGYTVHVPALPGCHTQGDTMSEAVKNAREAIACYLESLQADELAAVKQSREFVRELSVAL